MTRTLQGKYADRLEKENKELKQRIIKAIDYIKSDDYWFSAVRSEAKLLEILGGKENEI